MNLVIFNFEFLPLRGVGGSTRAVPGIVHVSPLRGCKCRCASCFSKTVQRYDNFLALSNFWHRIGPIFSTNSASFCKFLILKGLALWSNNLTNLTNLTSKKDTHAVAYIYIKSTTILIFNIYYIACAFLSKSVVRFVRLLGLLGLLVC